MIKKYLKSPFVASSVVLLCATLLIKTISFGNQIITANNFGTSPELESFLISLMISTFLLNMVSHSFVSLMIPKFLRAKEKSEESTHEISSDILGTSFYFILLGIFIQLVVGNHIVNNYSSGFEETQKDLAVSILYLLSPILLFDGLSTLYLSFFEANKRFIVSGYVPLLKPISIFCFLLLGSSLGIYSLVFGWLLGSIITFIFTLILSKKNGFDISLNLAWYKSPNAKEIIGDYIPLSAGALMTSSSPLIDQVMASRLPNGTIASLDYGSKLINLFLSVGTPIISGVVLPFFTSYAINKEWVRFDSNFKKLLLVIFGVSIFIISTIYFFGEPLVKLIYERGNFDNNDTVEVSKNFLYYSLQVPFYLSVFLIARLISSLDKNKYLIIGAIATVLLNVIFNIIFIQFFGGNGIALSTSATYFIVFIIYYAVLSHLFKSYRSENTI